MVWEYHISDPERVHWGQTPFRVNDDPEISQPWPGMEFGPHGPFPGQVWPGCCFFRVYEITFMINVLWVEMQLDIKHSIREKSSVKIKSSIKEWYFVRDSDHI